MMLSREGLRMPRLHCVDVVIRAASDSRPSVGGLYILIIANAAAAGSVWIVHRRGQNSASGW